jgi:WD40 repeat protein
MVRGFPSTFLWLFWSKDGRKLLIGTQQIGIIIYDVEYKQVSAKFESNTMIQQLELSRDGKTLAVVVYPTNSIRLINSETGELIRSIPITYFWWGGMTFSHDDKLLASLNENGEIIIWDVATGKEFKKLPKEEYGEYLMDRLSFSPDGKSLMASFIDHTYRVWDTNTWKLQRVFECEAAVFQFNPDGTRFVTFGGGSHEPVVWDFNSGRKLFNLSNPKLIDMLAIDFDPNGKYIVTGSSDANAIMLYDAKTGEPLRELAMGAANLAFSPDGSKLASVHQGKTSSEVIIWDLHQP